MGQKTGVIKRLIDKELTNYIFECSRNQTKKICKKLEETKYPISYI